MQSESHNLRYMGIDALGRIVKMNADFAGEHQLAVIDCLEDPDDTLKRKTLDLLYKMTKPNNVEVIVERMIAYMRTVTDTHSKGNIAGKVIELAERFAPTNEWFILVRRASHVLACRASIAPKQCLCSYVRVCNLRHRSTGLPMKRMCKQTCLQFPANLSQRRGPKNYGGWQRCKRCRNTSDASAFSERLGSSCRRLNPLFMYWVPCRP
jgi:hypothetical protein